ncbi:hypothetical protein BaRGS_00016378 [Batillaria attramentaria]|uniref:Uncharacterized protein n=1 Tax=Batillaria attramentaria TaxID=370345 RepID=A0ABD0KYH5_9CAEN
MEQKGASLLQPPRRASETIKSPAETMRDGEKHRVIDFRDGTSEKMTEESTESFETLPDLIRGQSICDSISSREASFVETMRLHEWIQRVRLAGCKDKDNRYPRECENDWSGCAVSRRATTGESLTLLYRTTESLPLVRISARLQKSVLNGLVETYTPLRDEKVGK